MTEKFIPAEIATNKPFEIRGHHLQNFVEFFMKGHSPEHFAQDEVKKFTENRESSMKLKNTKFDEFDFYSLPSKQDHEKKLLYYTDLMGTDGDSSKSFETNLANIYDKFEKLTDDATIRLTAGKPDRICSACTGGGHCSLRNHEKYGGVDDAVWADFKVIEQFMKASEDSGMDHPYMHNQEKVTFSDSPPANLVSYDISVADFKKTMNYVIKNIDNYPRLAGIK